MQRKKKPYKSRKLSEYRDKSEQEADRRNKSKLRKQIQEEEGWYDDKWLKE